MLRPSQRRWYHRWALCEVAPGGCAVKVISWHITHGGAGTAMLDLYTEYHPGQPYDWTVVPAADVPNNTPEQTYGTGVTGRYDPRHDQRERAEPE